MSASATTRAFRPAHAGLWSLLVLGLPVLALSGCSVESTTAPTPGSAPAATQASPTAAQPKPAEVAQPAATPDRAAVQQPASQAPGSALSAAKPTPAQPTPTQASADGHDHAPGDGHDHGMDAAAAAKLAAMQKGQTLTPEQQKLAAQQKQDPAAMKAQMDQAAKLGGDPMLDTDPNSKARVSYEFGSEIINFGRVMQGDVLKHAFALTSSGEEDLVIKQAKPTCGCTVAQLMVQDSEGQMIPYQFGQPIPPGRKIEIGATLTTANKRGHAGSKINVFTNDPRGQTILSLEADVEPFFNVTPPSINFQTLTQKDTATEKLSISTTKGQRTKLAALAENLPQGLKIDLRPLDADAEEKATRWELVATAGPGLAEGNLAYSVTLRSDLPIPGGEKLPNGQPPSYEVNATVMGRVTGPVSFQPQFLSLGLLRPGQALSRTIRVTCHDPEYKVGTPEVLVLGRDTEVWEYASNFTSVVRPVANENAVDIEVSMAGLPATVNGSFSGTLVIKLGHPDRPELRIPISGVVRGGAGSPAGAPR
jgi:hypothetical protein